MERAWVQSLVMELDPTRGNQDQWERILGEKKNQRSTKDSETKAGGSLRTNWILVVLPRKQTRATSHQEGGQYRRLERGEVEKEPPDIASYQGTHHIMLPQAPLSESSVAFRKAR